MELVALSDRQLRALALSDPELKRVFQGVYPSDRLPERPSKTTRDAYIVNTDPAGEPGQHWLALWTEKGVCEVMDSYGLPLTVYDAPGFTNGSRGIGNTWCVATRRCKPTTVGPVAIMPLRTYKTACDNGACWSLWKVFETAITCGTFIAWGNTSVPGSRVNCAMRAWTNPMDRIHSAVSLDVVYFLH